MSSDTQKAFAEALLDSAKPLPLGLRSWTGAAPTRRYGVYRNNVATGLARALAARFPVTEKIVGEEFFTAMARDPASPRAHHTRTGERADLRFPSRDRSRHLVPSDRHHLGHEFGR
jgi:hypothetical protein